jgi:hypothetical protein
MDQTVHIPIKSSRVLAFLRAQYAPNGFYKLSTKQSLGVFISSLLVSKNKCPQFIKHDSNNCFSVALGSYKHMNRKCFILNSEIEAFNHYAEHKMKEYFFLWMDFYTRFSGIDTKACIEKFISNNDLPDSETDVEYFRTSYKRFKNKKAA